MTNPWHWLIGSLIALLIGAAAFFAWDQQRARKPPPVSVAEAPAPVAPAAPMEPAIRHPIEEAPAAAREQAMPSAPPPASATEADRYIRDALNEALGRNQVLSFLNTDGFVQRVVTTVDNLSRAKAASRFWPVHPVSGRFAVERRGDGTVIGAENAKRYAPFVRFAEAADTARVAGVYVRLYPLFQQAYESLGYPGKYFNDRVVATIDHLLETPEPSAPLRVTLTEVKGPMAAARPWIMYEFEDRELESRSAGQKMLLRMGVDNGRRLKAKLLELRQQIARGAPPR
jgi:hypothetical protein